MRESGILMHITSLPGPYGIGSMGKQAYGFVDFLEKAGQSYWQILPLNPTGYGDSPYQAFSACAGNHYLIDLDTLVQEGLLKKEEIEAVCWGPDETRVDFGTMYTRRIAVLKLAFSRFAPGADYHSFVAENDGWLRDYSLFMALKEENGGKAWLEWPEALKLHREEALEQKRQSLWETVQLHQFLQYQFDRQWKRLRSYANGKGIRIIGDVPIYVPLDSADVWAAPELFQLDDARRPEAVAGCPPDAFTEDGQLWGNPIYNWQKMHETGYVWWIKRLKAAQKLYDVVRIDHFRGFESYWSIPYGDTTARNGRWVTGPGMDFINAVKKALPELDFIAEDLGYVTKEVRQLQLDSGYPGMKVIEFAFDSREESDYLPHLYPVESVCYTGTHDNVTLKQWFDEASPEDVAYAKAYLGLNQEEGYTWGMIRGGMSSVSRLFVAQMQDYLELGKPARMNFPGTLSMDNWTWRARPGFDSDALAQRIRKLTRLFGREKA
ncbi:MAG: 4-alpha-glucanotransferase [Oscillospiraceae bacterium]|nr:4-alpha-glucanotransferase [Oscillospiraceae bacterium]